MNSHAVLTFCVCFLYAAGVSYAAPAYCSSTGPRCITASHSSCRRNGVPLPDGDYQACEGCTYYHSCVAGSINYSFRSCPRTEIGGIDNKLVWDDNLKRCEYRSDTCRQCSNNGGGVCTSTGSRCITASPSSCTGRADGNYQACEGCTFFHSCVAGYLNYAFRDCAATNQGGINGKLVWDDNLKRCEYASTTCRQCNTAGSLIEDVNDDAISDESSVAVHDAGTSSSLCTTTGSGCITASPTSCARLPDGDYQACEGCTFFHSCVARTLNYAFRDCPLTNHGGINGKLVWDNKLKRCEYESTTCRQCGNGGGGVCKSTGSGCITASHSSCSRLADGDYQACEGCTFYHSCVAGYLNYAYRECPLTNYGGINGKLVWDDKLKRCEYRSTTCTQCAASAAALHEDELPQLQELVDELAIAQDDNKPDDAEAKPVSPCRTGPTCLEPLADACRKGDGDFQDCTDCAVYHSCSKGVLYANRRCAPGLFWDANSYNSGTCEWSSRSCRSCK